MTADRIILQVAFTIQDSNELHTFKVDRNKRTMDYLVNGARQLFDLSKPLDTKGELRLQGAPWDGGRDSAEVKLNPSAFDIRRVLDLWESRIEFHDDEQRQRDIMSEEDAIEIRDTDPQSARYKFLVHLLVLGFFISGDL